MPLMVPAMARLTAGVSSAGALAAEEVDLDEAHGVDVGIAQADGVGEDLVWFRAARVWPVTARTAERVRSNSRLEDGEDAVAEAGIGDERGVERGDAEVGFGQRHFDVADEVDEERELGHHGAEQGDAAGLPCVFADRVADAEPGGDEQAGLRPSEDPGDGAQAAMLALPPRRAGREPILACSSSATGVACSK